MSGGHAPDGEAIGVSVADRPAVGTVNPEEWQSFSRLTPWTTVLKMWSFILLAGGYVLKEQLGGEHTLETIWDVLRELGFKLVLIALAVLVVVSILSGLVATIAWHFTSFALTPDGVHYRRGVFIKTHRHVRWDRIQTVEVQRSLFARLFGHGAVRVDTGADDVTASLMLGLLRVEQCEGLRKALIEATDDAREGRPHRLADWRAGASATDQDPVLYQAEPRRILASTLRSGEPIGIAMSLTLSILFLAWDRGVATIPLAMILIGTLWSGFKKLDRRWGNKVFLTSDGIRARGGLTAINARAILPGRVHAITAKQPFLWRGKGWWRVSVTVVGQNRQLETSQDTSVIIPVGTREEVARLLWAVLPDLGVDDADAFIREAFEGSGASEHFVAAPERSRVFDWFLWRRNALALTRSVAVSRTGTFLTRRVSVIPLDRVQGLTLTQGPLQRRADLADVGFAVVTMPAPLSQTNMASDDAVAALAQASEVGRTLRAEAERETIEQWRVRVGLMEPPVQVDTFQPEERDRHE